MCLSKPCPNYDWSGRNWLLAFETDYYQAEREERSTMMILSSVKLTVVLIFVIHAGASQGFSHNIYICKIKMFDCSKTDYCFDLINSPKSTNVTGNVRRLPV